MRPNPIPLMTALLFLSLSLSAQDAPPFTLLLKNGSIIPEKNITTDALNQLDRAASRFQGKTYAVIQFEILPTVEQRNELKQAGIELLEYVPNNAFTATISGTLNPVVLLKAKARAVIELSPQQKMQDELVKGNYPPWAVKTAGTIDIWINFPATFSYEEVITELRRRNFDIISDVYKTYRVIALRIAQNRLTELASLPFIEYVEPAPHEDQLLNNNSRNNSRANVLQTPISAGGRDLRGQGITVGIGDNSDPAHVDFTGRRISRAGGVGNLFHGAHVHGIAGGGGIVKELYTGHAPKSTLLSQVFSGVFKNAPVYVTDHRMVITNNSYGAIAGDCSYNGLYDQYSRILDQQAFSLPNLQHVFASGNSATGSPYPPCPPYPVDFKTVLGSYQTSKNVLTVGNTFSDGTIFPQSSRGPVRDGRLKPEITAQGSFVISTGTVVFYANNTGTSMATPAVSGGLALLYQRYRQLNADADPQNGLMKAIICNTATDKGNAGPDYTYGFGWMNLLRAVETVEKTQYVSNSISTGGNNSFNVTVPANTAQLKVMLYWNDPAAASVASLALVNDLDLSVTAPGPVTVLPLILDTIPANVNNPAVQGVDRINNIEQVVINNPAPGTYSINVAGTSVPASSPQQYFVTYDTVPVSTRLTFPAGADKLVPGETVTINWDAFGAPANNFTVEYFDGASWNLVANVAANLRQVSWVVPPIATNQARVRVSRDATAMVSTGDPFTIIGAPRVLADPQQCEGYISMRWMSVPNVTDYEVMLLQGDEMASVGTTTDTFYTISGLSSNLQYWATVRARINGSAGRRDTAIARVPNGINCAGTISDNDLKLAAIISPARSGRILTSTALSAAMNVTIQIKNLDDVPTPAGDITVSYSVNGGIPVVRTITNPGIAGGGTLDYTFTTSTIDMSAAGTYIIEATVLQPGDPVPANNTFTKTFKQLDNPAITGLLTPFLDNMETAAAQTILVNQMGLQGLDRYDFVPGTVNGRLRTFINTGIAYSGNRAITLDALQFLPAVGNTDSLTGTFNLATFDATTDDIRLDFRYKNHGQVNNPANRVWIRGADNNSWIQVYDLFANQNPVDGSFKHSASIELSDFLAAGTQNFSSSFQVRWGQWGRDLAGDNDGASGYTFDDIRLYKVTDDIQMISIDTPIVSSCALSALTQIRISIRNTANTATVNPVPVEFRIDGGSWIPDNVPPIAANTTVSHTFSTPIGALTQGVHLIEVRSVYPTDTYAENDTASVTIYNAPVISSFPYLEDFESSTGSWHSGGKFNSWEYGTPASYKISRAASGSKAWKTSVSGNYSDQEVSYLYSPCFNITGMTVPTLSISLALDLEDCGNGLCDAAYMEYSADGKTWSRLGGFGQGTNWYNKNYSAGANPVWSVQDYTRWHVATIPLPTGLTNLRLRFVVASDALATREGIAVDDIHIYDNIYGIYPGPTMAAPVTQSISGGTSWIDFLEGGKLVASVQPNNQNMGNTTAQAYINTGPVRWSNAQYYHDRNITIIPEAGMENLTDSAIVRFYFLDTETERMINATNCGGCYKPSMAYELGVSKYSDPNNNFENGTIADNLQAAWLFINASTARKVPFDKGYYAEFKVKNFSEFWLNNGSFDNNQPLPVQLLSFTAEKKANQDVLTKWITASESNVNRYEIELAKGNAAYQQNSFIKIGTVHGLGNTTDQRVYSFTDMENDKSGVRYYRLKIIDNDGSFTYSLIRPVVFNDEVKWQVYPNPSEGIFRVSYQASEGQEMHFSVYDLSGRIVRQYKTIASGFIQKLSIDLGDKIYSSGLYLLEVSGGDKRESFRLIKQ